MMDNKFKIYMRKGYVEARRYVPGESLANISVSPVNNPESDLGYVARNPDNHADQWYIARDYFHKNYVVN